MGKSRHASTVSSSRTAPPHGPRFHLGGGSSNGRRERKGRSFEPGSIQRRGISIESTPQCIGLGPIAAFIVSDHASTAHCGCSKHQHKLNFSISKYGDYLPNTCSYPTICSSPSGLACGAAPTRTTRCSHNGVGPELGSISASCSAWGSGGVMVSRARRDCVPTRAGVPRSATR